MQFKRVIGQDDIKRQLIKKAKEEKIPHAQILTGPTGSGKLALSLAFGQYINCLDKKEDDSCGKCSSCRKYEKLIHPDLHFIYPVIKTDKYKEPKSTDYIDKWRSFFLENNYPSYEEWMKYIDNDNKQGVIYVFEGKDIIHKLSRKAFEGRFKVVIIWMPEFMNQGCANKILKTLEEPSENTAFLLVSEKEEEVIKTIRSRCQQVMVPRISDTEIEAALASHPAIGSNDPSAVAKLSHGNYQYALKILRKDEAKQYNHEKFISMMRMGYSRDIEGLVKWGDEIASIGRVRQKSLLEYCSKYLRENFLFNLKESDLVYLDNRERLFSKKFSPFINERNVLALFNNFEQAYRDIYMNGNAKIIFTDIALKVAKLIRL